MANIQLTLACEDYDRTRPIKDGRIKPEGIEINYLVMSVEEIFWRMMKYEEFDVSELSMGAFLTAAARGRRPFVAIPVFPSRTFRHRCIFINTASGIEPTGRTARQTDGGSGIQHDGCGVVARVCSSMNTAFRPVKFIGFKRVKNSRAVRIGSISKCHPEFGWTVKTTEP